MPANDADSDDDIVAQHDVDDAPVDNAPATAAAAAAAAAPAPAPALMPDAAIHRIVQLFAPRMLSKANFTGTAAELQRQLGSAPVDSAHAAFKANLPVVLALAISTWLHTNVISFASVSRLLSVISALFALLGLAFPRTVDSLLDLFSFATRTGPCSLSLDGERALQMHYLVLCRGCNSNAVRLGRCLTMHADPHGGAPTSVIESCEYQEFYFHNQSRFNKKCGTPWLSRHPRNDSLFAKPDQRVWVLGALTVFALV